MAKCPKCDKEIKGFRDFCDHCGAKIEAGTPENKFDEATPQPTDDIKPKIVDSFDIEELDINTGLPKKAFPEKKKIDLPKFEPVDYLEDDIFIDKGWDSWEKVKTSFYRDRGVAQDSEKEYFAKTLQEWMKKVDPHNYKKMFSKIKIESINEHPIYCALLTTLLEKRENIVEFERPYNNEKLYKKSVQGPEQADLWDYKSTDELVFLGSQQVFDIPDSIETELCKACRGKKGVCSYCRGDGKTICADCQGTGKVKCKSCRGSLKKTCVQCRGRGMVVGQKCIQCGGTGSEKCSDCDGGTLGCLKCLGKGKTICANCNGTGAEYCKVCRGSGKTIKGLQYTSIFKMYTEEAVFENKSIPSKIVAYNKNLCSNENIAAEIVVKKIKNYEFLEGVEYAALKMRVASMIQNSYRQMADLSKIRRQKLQIMKYPVWAMDYLYEGRKYTIYFKSSNYTVSFVDSPFDSLARSSLSRAKSYLYSFNFKNAVLSAERAKMFEQYAEEADRIISNTNLLFNIFYYVDGLLGALVGALVSIIFIMPSVKMTFNPILPVAVLIGASVLIGLAVTAVSRVFIKLKLSSFRLVLLMPFLAACLAVVVPSYVVFQVKEYNPYRHLDQKFYETEFLRRFPYGVPSVFVADDYNSLLEMRTRFKDFDVDKSKIEDGIKLQEQLMKKSLQDKSAARKARPAQTQRDAKPRSTKSEQNLELKWLKQSPQKKR